MRSTTIRILTGLLSILLFALSLWAEDSRLETGKLSWDLFGAAKLESERVRSGNEARTLSALMIADQQVTGNMLLELQDAGYEILGSYGKFISVRAPGDLYLDADGGVGSIGFITQATPPPAAIPSASQATYDSATIASVTQVHKLGYLGQGTRIAIIDEGFDIASERLLAINPSFHLARQSLDVPEDYETLEGAVGKQSEHGTACALVAAQIAPEAEFYLLSFPDGMGLIGWLWALDYAIRELGVDVVTSSIEFVRPFCHADGSGLLNQEVNNILRDTSSMLMIAAGNWAGGAGTNAAFYANTYSDTDGDGYHDFTPDALDLWDRKSLEISAHAGDRITIILEWDDWGYGVREQDLDLLLYESKRHRRIATSQAVQSGLLDGLAPAEILSIILPFDGDYYIVIEDSGAYWHGTLPSTVAFHLNILNETAIFETVEHHMAQGSIREVASNPNAISVGAVSPETGEVRSYSSCGNAEVLDYQNPKPELYAPDGPNAVMVGGFEGTSASTPYVAGVVLLLKSVAPDFSQDEIVALLQETGSISRDSCGNPAYSINILEAMQKALSNSQPEQ